MFKIVYIPKYQMKAAVCIILLLRVIIDSI